MESGKRGDFSFRERPKGLQKGLQRGLDAGNIRSLVELIKATGWELSRAMDVLQIPTDKREHYGNAVKRQLKLV